MKSNNKPMVSVVIPTYNRAKFVKNAIESILAQTYKNFEIIVVDDGSTDNTREAIDPYINNIHYIFQENSGVAAARNTGIRASRGKWVAFLDSDDRWLPEKLTYQMEHLDRTGLRVCFTNVFYEDEYGKKVANEEFTYGKPVHDSFDLVLDKNLYVQTMVVDKTLLGQAGFFDDKLHIADDTRMLYCLSFNQTNFIYIEEPMVIVERSTQRDGLINKSAKALRTQNLEAISILLEAYAHCTMNDLRNKSSVKKLRRKLGYQLSRRAEILCVDGDMINSRRIAMDAFYFGGSFKIRLRSFLIWCFPRLFRLRSKQKYS